MLQTLGVVQLPNPGEENSAADLRFRRLAGRSVLEWIVRRATDAQQLDGVIVLSGDLAAHREIVAAVPADVPVLLSQASDPLTRVVEAIASFPCSSVVLMSIDSPFVDPALIDRLVITAEAHAECDYIGYCGRDGRPAVSSPVGIFAEWCTASALKLANRAATEAIDRSSATRYLCSNPKRFQLRLLRAPEPLDRDDLRLRITCEEDWENASLIAEAIGQESLEWQCVADLLETQPAIRQQMARLNQTTVLTDS